MAGPDETAARAELENLFQAFRNPTLTDAAVMETLEVPQVPHALSRALGSEEDRPRSRGESTEHVFMGDQLKLSFDKNGTADVVSTLGKPLRIVGAKHAPLSYGQLIAMGGDFYGDPDVPISTSPAVAGWGPLQYELWEYQ
jgi:hypothetical protein